MLRVFAKLVCFMVREGLLAESVKYGFQLAAPIEKQYNEVTAQLRATTFMVHQYRHITKVMAAKGTAGEEESRKTSQELMDSHNAAFSDLPSAMTCPAFDAGVKRIILLVDAGEDAEA